MRWIGIAGICAGIVASGCSSGGDSKGVACYAGTDARAMCVQYDAPKGDELAYIMKDCQEVNGKLESECPAKNRIGVCKLTPPEKPSLGPPPGREVHHYLHPDVANDELIDEIAGRCGEDQWTPEPAGTST